SDNPRIHQYHLDATDNPTAEVWGGVAETIDRNIEDATILAGGSVAKSYAFTTQTINFPSSPNTEPSAINNSVDTAIGQYIGVVVGSYLDETGNNWHGFLIANGAYLTIDCPGANDTFAYGLSDATFHNAGYIVGSYDSIVNGSVTYHGFVYNIL